jgi:hypothetical protein
MAPLMHINFDRGFRSHESAMCSQQATIMAPINVFGGPVTVPPWFSHISFFLNKHRQEPFADLLLVKEPRPQIL